MQIIVVLTSATEPDRIRNRPLHDGFVQMMAPALTSLLIHGEPGCGK